MVKYCLKKYPKGSWKGQHSDGRFMDGWLYKNLELLADRIVDDMTFLGIIFSSTLEVGTGKSVMATQIGEAWTEIINKKYKLNLNYSVDNIVWRPKELIEKSFKLPKYSFILLDEWEDASYWSELGVSLRQFFRKCRQLNLFVMVIIPNWFQMPMHYAISRSIFAIDVRFNDKLERGFFAFYNFPAKKNLYIYGKKTHNYFATKPTFISRFPDGYGVDEEEYRKRKYEDMLKYDEENPIKLTKQQIENRLNIKRLKKYLEIHPKAPLKECAELFEVDTHTITMWKKGHDGDAVIISNNYNNNTKYKKKEIFVNEEELEQIEKQRGIDNYNPDEEEQTIEDKSELD